MEKINIRDIHFSNLIKLKNQGTQGIVYRDEKLCYKMLTSLVSEEKEMLYKKLKEMDGIKIEHVLFPTIAILKEQKLVGYGMQYFEDSIPLSVRFNVEKFPCKTFFMSMQEASQILRKIHQAGIVYGDLNFENILVNQKGEIAFCDMEGCAYQDYNALFVSKLLRSFLMDYRKEPLWIGEDTDKLSMILYFYKTIYHKEFEYLGKREYTMLASSLQTLINLEPVKKKLLDFRNPIQGLPYLDDVIDLNDDCVIDRNSRLKPLEKIFFKRK